MQLAAPERPGEAQRVASRIEPPEAPAAGRSLVGPAELVRPAAQACLHLRLELGVVAIVQLREDLPKHRYRRLFIEQHSKSRELVAHGTER